MIATRTLTAKEAERVRLLLPTLKAKEVQLRQLAAANGIDYEIPAYGGVRTQADQAQLVKWRDEAVARGEPSYAVAPYGKSFHEVGAAFDTKVTLRPASMSQDAAMRRLGELGESVGLVWGGRWSGKSNDPFHFQLPGTRADYVQAFAANMAAPVAGAHDVAAGSLAADVQAQLQAVLTAAGLAVLAVVIVRAS